MFLMKLWVKLRKTDDDWLKYTKDYTEIKFNSDDKLTIKQTIRIL